MSQKDGAGSLSNNSALAVLRIQTGTLWVGTDSGINVSSPQAHKFDVFQVRIDRQQGTRRFYPHQPGQKKSLLSNHVTALLEDHTGLL